jgi:hypothetical protein
LEECATLNVTMCRNLEINVPRRVDNFRVALPLERSIS